MMVILKKTLTFSATRKYLLLKKSTLEKAQVKANFDQRLNFFPCLLLQNYKKAD